MRCVSALVAMSTILATSGCAPDGASAFVIANLRVPSSCVLQPSGTAERFATGTFDISPSPGSGAYCDNPYYLNLLVDSNLRANAKDAIGRAEPNYLQVKGAEVHLMTVNKEPILFNRDKKKPPLPNPFSNVTSVTINPAVGGTPSQDAVTVEAIPLEYAHQLDSFVGKKILAEVQIFGTTIGDIDVNFKSFVYPIEICDGCRQICESTIIAAKKQDTDIYKDACQSDLGEDDQVCIDPTC